MSAIAMESEPVSGQQMSAIGDGDVSVQHWMSALGSGVWACQCTAVDVS